MKAFKYLLCIVLLAISSVALSQAENLIVQYDVGFDGYYRPGSWVPVNVSIENAVSDVSQLGDTEGFVGQLMITSRPLQDDAPPFRYIYPIEVPAASKKRFTMYVKLPELQSRPELTLNSENGKLLQSYPLSPNPADKDRGLLVRVTEQIAPTRLPALRSGLDFFVQTRMSARSLPDHWAGFDSVDVLVFPEWPSVTVPRASMQAMEDWVRMGGTLVLLGGQNTQTYIDDQILDLMPVELGPTSTMYEDASRGLLRADQLSEYQQKDRASFVVASSTPKEGTEVLLERQGVPLIVREKLGDGQIVYFALDMQSTSAALEGLLAPYWNAILPLPNLGSWTWEFPEALKKFRTLTGRAARPPNHFLIIIICILYTLIVGPINFAVLGKKKKLEWAWFTVPTIVLIFFFLIYGLGRLTKGGDNIIREVSLRRFQSGQVEGHALNVTGTFVSNADTYHFRPTQERHVLADPYRWHEWDDFRATFSLAFNPLGGGGGNAVGIAGNAPIMGYDGKVGIIFPSRVDMYTYDARTFVGRGPIGMEGPLDSSLTWKSTHLEGELRNYTGRDFEEAWIVAGRDVLPIGALKDGEIYELKPGQKLSRPITLGNENVSAWNSWEEFTTKMEALYVARPDTDSEIDLTNVSTLMTALAAPEQSGRTLQPLNGDIFFLGYLEEPLVDSIVSNVEAEIQSRAVLVMAPLNVNAPADSRFGVQANYVKSSLVTYDDSGRMGNFEIDDSGNLKMENATAIYAFELPFSDPNLRVTNLQIDPGVLRTDQSQDFKIEVYSYAPVPQWVEVKANDRIENVNYAMPVTGRVFLKVSSTSNDKGSNSYDRTTVIQRIQVHMLGVILPEEGREVSSLIP